jgi:hypothetical protein
MSMSGMKDMNAPSLRKDLADLSANYEELKQLRFTRHITAFDVDIDALEERPWRNKNVDILEYFRSDLLLHM